jgi:hypothetical protein
VTIAWQGEELLLPISPDQPCGASLEDTVLLASFDALRLFGQPESPEAPPDPADRDKETRKGKQPFEWAVIRGNALDALATSKDLRLLAYLGAAMLRTDGLPAFFRTLTIASISSLPVVRGCRARLPGAICRRRSHRSTRRSPRCRSATSPPCSNRSLTRSSP